MPRIVFTLEDGVEIVSELDSDVITVGRHADSIIVLPSGSVSSHHATIKRRGEDFYVQDLGTTNGTKLNGVEVEEARLEDGDRITFGDVRGIVHLTEDVAVRAALLPTPDIVAPSAPPLPSMTTGAVRRRVGAQKRPRLGQYQESTGCASFLIFILLMLLAFTIGLHVRHAVEFDGKILFMDLLEKMSHRAADRLEEPPQPETPAPTQGNPAGQSPTTPTAPATPTTPPANN